MQFTITIALVVLTVIISWQGFNKHQIVERLKHWPYAETRNNEWFRLITSGFVHGGWVHLGINMFMLWMFGEYVEAKYLDLFGVQTGRLMYLLMYFLAIIAGSIPTLLQHKNNPNYGAIGASGAVSAVLLIYVLMDPWQMLLLYGVIPIPAIVAGLGYLIYSSWAAKNRRDNIGHSAHFYGAIFGLIFTVALKPEMAAEFMRNLSQIPWG